MHLIKNGKPNGRPGPTGKLAWIWKAVYDAQADPDGTWDLNTGEIIEWNQDNLEKGL